MFLCFIKCKGEEPVGVDRLREEVENRAVFGKDVNHSSGTNDGTTLILDSDESGGGDEPAANSNNNGDDDDNNEYDISIPRVIVINEKNILYEIKSIRGRFKYLLFNDCNLSDAELAELYPKLYELVLKQNAKGIAINDGHKKHNPQFDKLPHCFLGCIIKLSGMSKLEKPLKEFLTADKKSKDYIKYNNALSKALDDIFAHNYTASINYNMVNKIKVMAPILTGTLIIECDDQSQLSVILSKVANSNPGVKYIKIILKKSSVLNMSEEIVDTLLSKFPSCVAIRSDKQLSSASAQYIRKNYPRIIELPNVNNYNLDFDLSGLEPQDFELFKQCIDNIASGNPNNIKPLGDAVRADLRAFRRASAEDKMKIKKSLDYIAKFPVGDLKVRIEPGSPALATHIEGMKRAIEIVVPGMPKNMMDVAMESLTNLMIYGKPGYFRPKLLLGSPGIGKTRYANAVATGIAYIHSLLPDYPDLYKNPTDEEVEKAVSFAVDTWQHFHQSVNLPSLAGKSAIEGTPRIFVSSDGGLVRHYTGLQFEYNGRIITPIVVCFNFDEADKMPTTASPNDGLVSISLFGVLSKDSPRHDAYIGCINQEHPIIAICTANEKIPHLDALMSRMDVVEVPGYSNIEKRDLIFELVNQIIVLSLPGITCVQEGEDIVLQFGDGAKFVVIKSDAFNAIIEMSGEYVGVRALKDHLNSLISAANVIASQNAKKRMFAKNKNYDPVVVTKDNIGLFLREVISHKKKGLDPGSFVCANRQRDERKAQIVVASHNGVDSNNKITIAPGAISNNQNKFQPGKMGDDIGLATFNALCQIVKNGSRLYKDPKYSALNNKLTSLEGAINNHFILDMCYNMDSEVDGRVAGTAGVIAWASKISNKAPIGFMIGYCDAQGIFNHVDNPGEVFNLCINKLVDLDKIDEGNQQVIRVVIPKVQGENDIMKKFSVHPDLIPFIEIVEAENILDVMINLIPGLV